MASSSRMLSLNLGSQTVTLADFSSTDNGGLTLNGYATHDLVQDGGSDSARGAQITEAIRVLMSKLRLRGARVKCCIPAQSVFTRFVKLPTVDEDKIDQIIGFEAQQNVPFPINEVVWDYQLVASGDASKLGVVLVAIKSDLLDEIDHGVEVTGLRTSLVDVAPMALYNAFRYNYNEVKGSSLIVDIGAKTTNLIFIEPQKIFSRSIPIGGSSITAAIAKEFNESLLFAERRKKKDGFVSLGGAYAEPDDPDVARVSKIIRNTMTRLHAEITRSISFYRAQQQGTAPVRIYLCGGSVGLSYMREFFQEKMQLPIEFFNPLRNVTVSSSVEMEKVMAEAHILGEVVGVALRQTGDCPIELDLLPPEVVRRQEMARRQPYLITAGICLLLTLLGWFFYYKNTTTSIQAVVEKISAESAQLQSFDQKFKAAETANKAHFQKVAPLIEAINQRQMWTQLLDDLNQRLPANRIWITVLDPLQDGKPMVFGDLKALTAPTPTPAPAVKIPGKPAPKPVVGPQITELSIKGLYLDDPDMDRAAKMKIIDDFVENLRQSPYFLIDLSKIKEVIISRQTPNEETWAYDYELRLPLKNPIPLK